MKRIINKIIMLFVSVTLIISASVFTSYADEKMTVNGEEVKVGSIITYNYYFGGVEDKLAGISGTVEYDADYLKMIDDSFGSDILSSAMYAVSEGEINYSALNAVSGFDVSEEKLFITVSFEVTKNAKGSTVIKNTFDELFTVTNLDRDLTKDEYTDSDSVSVDSENVESSAIYKAVDANDDKAVSAAQQKLEEDLTKNIPSDAISNSSSSNGNTTSNTQTTSNMNGSRLSSSSENIVASNNVLSQSGENTSEDSSVSSQSNDAAVSSEIDNVSDNNISADLDSHDKAVSMSNVIVVIVIAVFVIVCIGAAVFYFKSKR